jgi:hypothetical protein
MLIHELAHVWQSQHHPDPLRFIVNAADCQAAQSWQTATPAWAIPGVMLHQDHPVQFPSSAYAYLMGPVF